MGDGGVHLKAHLFRHVATSLSALKRFSMKYTLKAFSLAGFDIRLGSLGKTGTGFELPRQN